MPELMLLSRRAALFSKESQHSSSTEKQRLMQTGSGGVLQQRHLDWYVGRMRLGTGRDEHLYSPANQEKGLGMVRGNIFVRAAEGTRIRIMSVSYQWVTFRRVTQRCVFFRATRYVRESVLCDVKLLWISDVPRTIGPGRREKPRSESEVFRRQKCGNLAAFARGRW